MAELYQSGRIIDIALAVIVLEFLVLTALSRKPNSGFAVRDFTFTLLSGAGLLIALRLFVTGADWTWIAVSLCAAGAAHVCDVLRILRR